MLNPLPLAAAVRQALISTPPSFFLLLLLLSVTSPLRDATGGAVTVPLMPQGGVCAAGTTPEGGGPGAPAAPSPMPADGGAFPAPGAALPPCPRPPRGFGHLQRHRQGPPSLLRPPSVPEGPPRVPSSPPLEARREAPAPPGSARGALRGEGRGSGGAAGR